MFKDQWEPVDGLRLEDEALIAVTSNENRLVVAGPGSGKTELLAQRACYLLQTNECRNPKRILAISFKKDAAKNLKDRVEKRCGKELSRRFESMTYDAFAKSLLDRFREGLPEDKQPSLNYEIVAKFREEINPTKISFETISNLALLIIQLNPLVKKGIQLTYGHVFLDEFQDTTNMQYEIVKSCFKDSNSIITAVGDGKQRIMLWAGARETVFEDFKSDFKAESGNLIMNHRSAPRLVAMQEAMYSYLNEKKLNVRASNIWDKDSGEAFLRFYKTTEREKESISLEIKNLISNGVPPNEICILTKQTPEVYTSEIIERLREYGIRARDEQRYQELLSSELPQILLLLFKLTINKSDIMQWEKVLNLFYHLNGLSEESPVRVFEKVYRDIEIFVSDLEKNQNTIQEKGECKAVICKALELLGKEKILKVYPEYQNITYYEDTMEKFLNLFWQELKENKEWILALESLEGKYSVPIMTIHKSKGLEFQVIIFIGLEDSAFWNFSSQSMEDKCAFFVALSRAKKRIDFTFCKGRSTRFNSSQNNVRICELYNMLRETTFVKEIDYD